MFVVVDDFDTQEALRKTSRSISPTSLGAWLATDAARLMREAAQDRFTNEGDASSGGWAPLKWPTQNIREALGYDREHPINVRTGNLRDWVINNTGSVNVTGYGSRLTWPTGTTGDPELQRKYRTAQRGKARPPTVPRPVVALGLNDVPFMRSSLLAWVVTRGGLEYF